MTLPPLPPVGEIRDRLLEIFPEGSPNRGVCTREIAAKTVFTMLYAGAVTGLDYRIRPDQVTRMTDAQASRVGDDVRLAWRRESIQRARREIVGRWYAANTRESIRDETLRQGLVQVGAVDETDVATTSPVGRYALAPDFAALFAPDLRGAKFRQAADEWRKRRLTTAALARVTLTRRGGAGSGSAVNVRFPGGEARRLAAGPSSELTKAVIEEFAPRFLVRPTVILVSESRRKIVDRDDALARQIGIEIDAAKVLPDVLLADVGGEQTLLVFVEVVATDGPITEQRRAALGRTAAEAGYDPECVAFVSVFKGRENAPLKRSLPELAWNSFVWIASEPDRLIGLLGEREGRAALSGLKRSTK